MSDSSVRSHRPRVAVYAIAKDEQDQLGRWVAAASDADFLMIADTGSTDDTVRRARSLGVEVHEIRVVPFRFDQARNHALGLLPDDVDLCVSIDLDEVLDAGWRAQLDAAWLGGATKVVATSVWQWSQVHAPLRSPVDRIHARHGYRWESPVHEWLVPLGPETVGQSSVEILHLRDPHEERPEYLGLLHLAVNEQPDNGRLAHMLANELRMRGFAPEAVAGFRHALSLTMPPNERLHSLLMLAFLETDNRSEWLLAACAEFPGRRDPWCQLSQYHLDNARWRAARASAHVALSITEAADDYLANVLAWGTWPDRVAARASISLGDGDWAQHHVRHIRDAQAGDPEIVELTELLDALEAGRHRN